MRYSISEWGCIINDAQNERKDLFDLIVKNIERSDPPDTKWEFQNITTKGIFVLISLRKREFLVITSQLAKGYEIDVCADPFGNSLTVHAGLVIFQKPVDWSEGKISWEDQTLVSDWTSVIFRSIQDACQEIVDNVGQKPEKLKREAKGILSVW